MSYLWWTSQIRDLLIFAGECNSCGYIPKRELLIDEIGITPQIKILNNKTEVIEDLDVPFNNNYGHANVDPGRSFGWEVFVANQIKAGKWGHECKDLCLVKTGQGGMKSNQWFNNDEYFYRQILIYRYNKFKDIIGEPLNPIMWLQQGSNEQQPHERDEFKQNMFKFFDRLRQDIPDIPVIMTTQPPWSIQLDPVVKEIPQEYPGIYVIDVSAANEMRQDEQHWGRSGMDYIAELFRKKTVEIWNTKK